MGRTRSWVSVQLTCSRVGEVEAALDADATAWPPSLGARRLQGIHNHRGTSMKHSILHSRIVAGLLLAFLSTINLQLSGLHAQGTAFTYQGRLAEGGQSANGSYDLRFALYDAATSGSAV